MWKFHWKHSATRSMAAAWSTGGTESILLAVKASRDYMVAHRGITAPEMVVGPSAHAAYWKAAEYFNIKLVIAPLGKDLRWVSRRGDSSFKWSIAGRVSHH
jgi:sphinganine-1-phosphate aldolase